MFEKMKTLFSLIYDNDSFIMSNNLSLALCIKIIFFYQIEIYFLFH